MPTQWCAVHAERHAFARCMRCLKTLCQECATQWDGIWHCAACLTQRRTVRSTRSPAWRWLGVIAVSLVLLYLGARLMVWMAAVVAALF